MKINKDLKNKIESNALSIATVNSSGKPHCIAVAYAKIKDNKIIITDNYMSKTPKNIRKNPNISLVVFSRNWEKDCWGFELRGTAEYFTKGKWHKFVRELPENKDYAAKGAIVVTVNKIKKLA